MHRARAAAAVIVSQHAQAPAVVPAGIAAQRIGALQRLAVLKLHRDVHVRARVERRKQAAVRAAQHEAAHAGRFVAHLSDDQFDGFHGFRHPGSDAAHWTSAASSAELPVHTTRPFSST